MKPRGKPFKKGQSGNPAGKPKGAKRKTTLIKEALILACADRGNTDLQCEVISLTGIIQRQDEGHEEALEMLIKIIKGETK